MTVRENVAKFHMEELESQHCQISSRGTLFSGLDAFMHQKLAGSEVSEHPALSFQEEFSRWTFTKKQALLAHAAALNVECNWMQ